MLIVTDQDKRFLRGAAGIGVGLMVLFGVIALIESFEQTPAECFEDASKRPTTLGVQLAASACQKQFPGYKP